MSLQFTGADTDNVECGSGASLDDLTAFTWWAWIFLDADVADTMHRGIFSKLTSNVISGKALWINSVSGSNNLRVHIQRATTPAAVQGGDVPVASWAFVALTYDESDGARLWLGSLTSAPAEVASGAGSGATSADATANLYLGNRAPNNTPNSESLPGKIACAGVLAERLTQSQLIRLWRQSSRAFAHDVRGFWLPGRNGTTNVPDYSGNGNTGTVTGATIADDPPLPPVWPGHAQVFIPAAIDFPLDAQPGSYTLTGQVAGSDVGVGANAGSYALTGLAATFDVGLPATAGAFTLTGQAATADIGMNAAPGAVTWTGVAAELVHATGPGDFPLDAQPGSFALSGIATGFDVGMDAETGSYAESGLPAGFDLGVNAAPGTVAWTGVVAGLLADYVLDCQPGAITWTGVLADISAGAVGFAIVASIGARSVVVASISARTVTDVDAIGVRPNIVVSEVSGGGS